MPFDFGGGVVEPPSEKPIFDFGGGSAIAEPIPKAGIGGQGIGFKATSATPEADEYQRNRRKSLESMPAIIKPVFSKIADFETNYLDPILLDSSLSRASDTAGEIMTGVDNPNKPDIGSEPISITRRPGSIFEGLPLTPNAVADLAGSLVGFVAGGEYNAGAKLWLGVERTAGNILNRFAPNASKLATEAGKVVSATIPYEASRAHVNNRPIDPAEMATSAGVNAALSLLPYGVGRVLRRGEKGKLPVVETAKPEAVTPYTGKQKKVVPQNATKPTEANLALDEAAMSAEPAMDGSKIDIEKGVPFDNGQKPRSLDVSAANSPWSKPEYVDALAQDIRPNEIGVYDPITNKQTIKDAQAVLAQDPGAVVRRILDESRASDRVDNTAGLLLVKQANETGDISLAVDLTEALAKKATEAGQAIQALSIWGRLTPEGMLTYGQKVIARANYDLLKNGVKKPLKMSEETANKVLTYMRQADGLTGEARDIKVKQALAVIAEQVPPSLGRKLSTIQTIAQLFNPKTAIRNVVGNLGFGVMENVSNVAGVGIDKAVSGITRNRTKVLPSIMTQVKGGAEGLQKGIRDARLGIDTSNMAGGKFDIPEARTFTKGFFSKLETAMNIELRATDRAFYQAAYNESLRQQIAAAKLSKNPPDMKTMQEIAHFDALYRTFQDDSLAAKAFSTVKRALNLGKDFGIGDFVLKYPKTPANLLTRGIEYSPAGFIKTVMELGKPVFGREFNQKAFVESTSRALVGTVTLVGTGALMHKLGLITGGPNEDKDVEALNAQAGFGKYKVNVTGLKRFILSGFDPKEAKIRKGDITVSYDWFQPNSIGLAMGADIDQNKGQKTGIVGKLGSVFTLGASGLVTGINAFAEQPVLQGVQQLFSGQRGDVATGVFNILEGVPASFVPTLLNQVKQLIDNDKRVTYSPNYVDEMKNRAISRIPFINETLPVAYGTLGQPLKTYQEGSSLTNNNLFNVFFNPAFVNQYQPSPGAQKVLDVYGQTGEEKVIPRVTPKYIVYTPENGKRQERIDLTSEEYAKYQRLAGEYTVQGLSKANTFSGDAVKTLTDVLTNANKKAREKILKSRGIAFKT